MATSPAHSLSQQLVLEWYCSPDRDVISAANTSTTVIRHGHFAIKFGPLVVAEEAINQHEVSLLLDPTMIRVPTVYAFFKHKDDGYIAMEYIHGERFDDHGDLTDLARRIDHMHSFRANRPGSIAGRLRGIEGDIFVENPVSHCLLWPEYYTPALNCRGDLEAVINGRVFREELKVNLKDTEFRLCHSDLAPRNILRAKDGSLVLLDWDSAGYWPRAFEFAALRNSTDIQGTGYSFSTAFEAELCAMNPLNETEIVQREAILEMSFNCIRYGCLGSKPEKKKKRRRIEPISLQDLTLEARLLSV